MTSAVLFIVVLVFTVGLFSVELVLAVAAKRNEERQISFTDQTYLMSYERTPIESLLTTEENIAFARNYFKNPEAFEALLRSVKPSVVPYPLIRDLKTSANYDEETKNIVVFGDSFVWGEASLNRNELFWRQLERMLRAKGYNVRVYAVAAEGASAYEEIRWLESGVLEDLKPDMVLFGYVCNDALRPGNGFGAEPVELEIPPLRFVKKIWPNLYRRLYHYIDAKTIYSRKFGDAYRDSWISVLDGEVREYYQTNFADKLSAFSKAHDLPAAVVTLPNETNSPLYEELFQPLKEIYAGTGIGYYDSYPAFKAVCSGRKHRNNIYVNVANVHPGSAAHWFYADFICKFLLKDFSGLLGEPADHDLNSSKIAANEIMPGKVDVETVFESDTSSEYLLSYPDIQQAHHLFEAEIYPYCLTDPISKDYVKLSFENPVNISSVTVSAQETEDIDLYYTTFSTKLHYDNGRVFSWEPTKDNRLRWESSRDEGVASLCIHAGKPCKITITVQGRVAA